MKVPCPLPPAGRVVSKDLPGTKRCDIMGTGLELQCRRISHKDLDWLTSQAGLKVTAEPGDCC